HDPDNKWHWRDPIAAAGSDGTAWDNWRTDGFGRLVLLKVRVAIDRHTLGIFERVKVWRDIHVQKFSIDEQEPFCVRKARKLRKIVRLDLREARRTNLRHPRRFIEREISRAPRFLKFFTEPFYRHYCEMPAKRQHRDRPESRVVWRLRRDLKYRAAPEYQRCARRGCNRAAAGAEAMKWRRAFPAG